MQTEDHAGAGAIRYELQTGNPVKGHFHSQKGQEFMTRLNKWLRNNPTASDSDRRIAENLLLDLYDALGN